MNVAPLLQSFRTSSVVHTTLPLAAGIVTLLAVWFWDQPVSPSAYGFPLDDAWIHMVYAREVAQTGTLAYNRGVPATGATSPLWVGILAVVQLLNGQGSVNGIILGAYAVAAACFLFSIFLLARLTTILTSSQWVGTAAGIVLAISPPMAAAAFSGMEPLLCAALLLASFLSFFQRRFWLAGIALGLAFATRPEAMVVIVLLASATVVVKTDRRHLLPLLLPSMIVGVLWGYHNYQATGFLLPATFYLKRNFVHIDQVHSVWVGLSAIVDRIPPFWAHAVWLSLGGFLILGEIRKMGPRTILPILGGLLFLAGNLVVVPPLDPSSFYHIRYIMPAIPLLISGCAVGLLALVRFLHGNARIAAAIFLVTGIVGCAATLPHASARLHNDIRNINEVQVAMGEWVGAHTGPQAWIATSDAGAVRYFSNRPSIDLMGLNTPEVLVGGEEWVKARPARILTFMPSWFQPVHQKLGTIREFTTEPYTVTKWPQMATQIAAVCLADTNAAIVRVDLAGVRSVRIYCVPFREH